MSLELDRSKYTKGVVTDYFTLENHMLSTRTADLYKGLDRERGKNVAIWLLRHPIAKNSPAVDRFFNRITKISSIGSGFCTIQAAGIDNTGTAFCAISPLDGFPIVEGGAEGFEAERRFMSAIRLVDLLHSNGIICGDLCGTSFWVNRSGDVGFIGVMGSFDSEAVHTALAPPLETLHYVAPEQRSGGGFDQSSDIFSLGVLGYSLLTRNYPGGSGGAGVAQALSLDDIRPVSELTSAPPVWADEVIFKCLDPIPGRRFASASQILTAISEIRARVLNQSNAPAIAQQKTAVPVRSAQNEGRAVQIRLTQTPKSEPENLAPKTSSKKITVIAAVSAFIAIVLLVALVSRSKKHGDNTLTADLKSHQFAGSEEINKAIRVIGADDASLTEKQARFEALKSSDDPLAHEVLVKSAVDAKDPRIRVLAEDAIIERARRLGLMRASSEVKVWLRNLSSGEVPSSYEAVLRSLDTTLPVEARGAALRQAYATAPSLVIKLTAALALDSSNPSDYQPVLSQLVGDSLKLEDAGNRSVLALILAHGELSKIFAEDVIQKRDTLTNDDLTWLLKVLGDRNDLNIRPIASAAIDRKVLPPIRAFFLGYVRDRGDLPREVLNTLVRAAGGVLRTEDVKSVGSWFDISSEDMLFAFCADSVSPEIQLEAFDYVAGKGITAKPAGALIDWIRQKQWDRRGELAHVIGIIAHIDLFTMDEVRVAFGAFDTFVKDSPLLDILLDSGQAPIIKVVMDKYGPMVGIGRTLTLLDHSDKDVRMAAINSLRGTNDVEALKVVIDHYATEVDPDVRAAYKDNFWVIKQRAD